jgi:predicted ArsR family transcriptional regulator
VIGRERLTPRQQQVLAVLFTRGDSTASDGAAWWPMLTPGNQVRGILGRLEGRGLVQVVTIRFNRENRAVRVYGITAAGREALEGLDAAALLEDGDE